MAFQVRRVVVAHDTEGRAGTISDERIPVVSRGLGHNIDGAEMWSTDAMPVDNAPDADAAQRRGFIKIHNDYNYVGSGQGTTFRITEWLPGHARFTHRTHTLDYDVVLGGEIDLDLEGGETIHLNTGDVVIMRGCTHTWINRSDKPAVTAFMLIDAAPVETPSGPLEPLFPAPPDA